MALSILGDSVKVAKWRHSLTARRLHSWKEDGIALRNAEELTTKFQETNQSVGLSVNDMRAQAYDGASVMSGHVSGVQTRIRQVNPNAVYVHCRPHVLNLCIVHASKLPLVRNIMNTMQEVTLAFKFSAKRLLAF